jgi:PPOX class probable F420-dependent enzyme
LEVDRHVESRLKREKVIWLVTTGKDEHPQAVPVWFLWDGRSFLIYAQPGIKVRHVRENPNVELHLNSDEVGDDVVRASGQATVAKTRPRALDAAYLRKYTRDIKNLDMTPEGFFESYPNVIRVQRVRFH